MYLLLIPWLLAWVAAANACVGDPPAQVDPPAARKSGAPVITVVETDPAWLVFREYTGPYWGVGRFLVQVRGYMIKHGQTGRMFVRYQRHPLGSAAAPLRCQAGFISDRNHRPLPPFATVRRGRELVARMVVEGRSATKRRDYERLHAWVERHGYVAAGPVTEVYGVVPAARADGPQRTEILVSLVKRVAEAPSGARRPAVPAKESSSRPVAAAPAMPTEVTDVSQGQAREFEPYRPVRELMASERFDRIARQLMPDEYAIPTALQVWFGHVVFRLVAVVKGLNRTDSGAARVVVALADAITSRYDAVSGNFQFDPLAQVLVRVDGRGDSLAVQRQAVIRDLDMLLGAIAYHTVAPEVAADKLIGIVQRVQDALREYGAAALGTAVP